MLSPSLPPELRTALDAKLEGLPRQDAAASIAVQRMGAAPSMPTAAEVEAVF